VGTIRSTKSLFLYLIISVPHVQLEMEALCMQTAVLLFREQTETIRLLSSSPYWCGYLYDRSVAQGNLR
jgi:hypothetical protein